MSSHFLVPIDFTETTLNAFKFAIQLSKSNDDNFTLLHIIKHEDERIVAKQKLDQIISESSIAEDKIAGKIIVGKFLNDIGKIAESLEASLIVMGTHGSTGLQKVFGSNAMKVVSNSKTPLLIVQENSVFHAIKKIILTIDLEKESIQVVKYAAKIGETDDLVMSSLLAVRMLQVLQSYHQDLDVQMRDHSDNIIEPLPFVMSF